MGWIGAVNCQYPALGLTTFKWEEEHGVLVILEKDKCTLVLIWKEVHELANDPDDLKDVFQVSEIEQEIMDEME